MPKGPLQGSLSRRAFLALTGAAALAPRQSFALRKIPVGLQLFAVRDALTTDLFGTVRSLAKLGYQDVEFYGTYLDWTDDYAKQVRSLLDDLGIRCISNQNESKAFTPEGLPRTIELNHILGSRYVVMVRSKPRASVDEWKQLADLLNQTSESLRSAHLICAYHNHADEFQPLGNTRPIDVLAANTTKDVVFELNVGTSLQAGADPLAFIRANPGRIALLICSDWAPGSEWSPSFPPMIGQGIAPWKELFRAAEQTGGLQCYILQQEGTHLPPLEMARDLLISFRKLHH